MGRTQAQSLEPALEVPDQPAATHRRPGPLRRTLKVLHRCDLGSGAAALSVGSQQSSDITALGALLSGAWPPETGRKDTPGPQSTPRLLLPGRPGSLPARGGPTQQG